MGFSFKGLFCGSEPNKMKLKNEINQRFSNNIENDIITATKEINTIINTAVEEIITTTTITGDASSDLSQALILTDSLIEDSTLNFNFNSDAKSKQNQFAYVMKNTTSINDIRTKIIDDIKSKAAGNTDFKALLASMNSANNNQSELTQGEMNNMINKLTGLFDYSSTNTNITNVVDTELQNIIKNRTSNENFIENTVNTLFKTNKIDDSNNACLAKSAGDQLASISKSTIRKSTLNVNFNMMIDTVSLCTTNSIVTNSSLKKALTDLKNTQDTSTESKISASVTMKMTNSATNISEEKTTSFVNSFFDMVMYIGIAGIVLLTVVAIVFLLRKGPKPHTGSDNSLLNKIELPFTSTAQVKAPSVPIKPPVAPVKAPMPTKRIPGLPKF